MQLPRFHLVPADALEQDIITLLVQDMKRTSESASGEIYTDGLTNVLSEPEFAESDEARWAMRLFEERSTLQDLIARASTNSSVGGLQVLIGGEGGWEELRQCSMVIARYGAPGSGDRHFGRAGTNANVLRAHDPHREICGRIIK